MALSLLILDGKRFTPYTTDDESKFEEYVKQYYKEIFGEKSLLFEKKKLTSLSGISSIPDGFVVTFQQSKWYIIEVELATHDPQKHIVPQINTFLSYIKNPNDRRQLVNAFNSIIKRDEVLEATVKGWLGKTEIHEFLSDTVFNKPQIVIIIDEKTEKLMEATEIYQPRIIEFKIFQREGVGISVSAVQFEPIVTQKGEESEAKGGVEPTRVLGGRIKKGEATPKKEYVHPLLEVLIEMGGSGKVRDILDKIGNKMRDKLTAVDQRPLRSGKSIRWRNRAMWVRNTLKNEGYLKADSPNGIWEITEKGRELYRSSA